MEYEVTTDISVDVLNSKATAAESGADNLMEVGSLELDGAGAVVSNNGTDGFDLMQVSAAGRNSDDYFKTLYGHEFGHLLGLPDSATGIMDNIVPAALNERNFVDMFTMTEEAMLLGVPDPASRKGTINGKAYFQNSQPISYERRGSVVLGSRSSTLETRRAAVGHPPGVWVQRTKNR